MDSRNIFISSQHCLTDFNWSEPIYVGLNHETASEFKLDKVTEYAHSLFDKPAIYVVVGRRDSYLTNLDEALLKVNMYLKMFDILLCNMSFTKAMQFYKIGVMKFGQKRQRQPCQDASASSA